MTGKTVLINGLLPYDSGKTWFTISLYKSLVKHGARAIVFKPVAAHNLWYSVKPLALTIKLRKLIGNDALLYYKETGRDPALLNPIAMASAPLDPERYGIEIHRYMEDSSVFLSQLVMARISNPVENRTTHYIVRENVEKTVPGARKIVDLLEKALTPLETTLEKISRFLTSSEIDGIVESSLDILRGEYEIVLMESFNDAIVPTIGLVKSVNTIITVAPGKAYFYDEKASKAIMEYVQEKIKDPGSLIVSGIFSITKPSAVFNIPLLTKPKPGGVFKTICQFLSNRM